MNSSQNIVTNAEFVQLLSSNEPRLTRIARVYGSPDWQDLLQEIFLQLWRSREKYRGDSQASTWLYRVALNTALTFSRKKKLDSQSFDERFAERSTGQPLDQSDLLTDFLLSLNQANRAVLLLFLDGMDNDEIAAIFSCSAGSIATRLTRLKRKFEQLYLEDS